MAKANGAQLSRREMAAWRGLLRTHARVLAALDAELEQTHGLAVPEYEVLLVLNESGDKHLRMSELADAALLTRSGMTRLVDRLERQGLVRRERCAADGRGTFAVITRRGRERFAAARPTHIAGVRRLFLDPLKKKDQRALGDAFDTVLGETAQPRVVYPRGGMRPAPELAGGRTPIQVALARVRLPTGPRACELAAHRGLRPRRGAGAHAADAAARAAERVRHGRLLRALRRVPARAPEPRRLPALEPVRVLGPSLRRRSAVGRALPAGTRVVRPPGPGERDGRARHVPLPARDALVVRVRASLRRRAPGRRVRRHRVRRRRLPARPLAGARAADGRRLARCERGGGAVRRDAPGARSVAADPGRRRSRSRSWAARSSSRSSRPPPRSSCSCCSCAGAVSRSSRAPGRWRSGSPRSRSCRDSSS